MIYSYCKHCGVESCGDVCAQCGKRAPAPCQMDKWTVDSLPLADSRAWKTTLLSLLLYRSAFTANDMGYACALAWVLFLLSAAFSAGFLLLRKKLVYFADEEGTV